VGTSWEGCPGSGIGKRKSRQEERLRKADSKEKAAQLDGYFGLAD